VAIEQGRQLDIVCGHGIAVAPSCVPVRPCTASSSSRHSRPRINPHAGSQIQHEGARTHRRRPRLAASLLPPALFPEQNKQAAKEAGAGAVDGNLVLWCIRQATSVHGRRPAFDGHTISACLASAPTTQCTTSAWYVERRHTTPRALPLASGRAAVSRGRAAACGEASRLQAGLV